MAKQPTLPLYYNDIARTCSTWTDEEFGCYMRLLIQQWDAGGIPLDTNRISRLVTSFEKNWPLIKEKFKEVDGILKNPRMEEIREKYVAFSEKQRNNIKKRYQKATKPSTKNLPNSYPRVENENTIYCKYIEGLNELLNRKYKGSNSVRQSLMARIKEGRTLEEILLAVKNASKDTYHIEQQYKYLTPEFFLRPDKLDKFSQTVTPVNQSAPILKKPNENDYYGGANDPFYQKAMKDYEDAIRST